MSRIKSLLFFLDDLSLRHHKTALLLKIGLWCVVPFEMLGLTLAKRAYKRLNK